MVGGYLQPGGTAQNTIQKFPFASATTNTTDVGDLLTAKAFNEHQASSQTHGYVAAGHPIANVIEKYAFATDGNSTDVGDLTITTRWGAAATSTTHGYSLGGYTPSPGYHNVIQKFSTSSDQNATDVGDLTVNRDLGVGAQY